jgi:hypothetical protein
LVVTTTNESGQKGHTFADRRIALHCAAWISDEFKVWVWCWPDSLRVWTIKPTPEILDLAESAAMKRFAGDSR